MADVHEIQNWCDHGINDGKKYMAVIFDSVEPEDYPVFFSNIEDLRDRVERIALSPGSMLRVMETYDLQKDISEQISAPRAWVSGLLR